MAQAKYSKKIDFPTTKVWAMIRDFGAISQWMPFVAKCELKDGARPDQVGAVRQITRADGEILEETLLELSDYKRRIVFSISKGDVPTLNAIAIITVHEIFAEGNSLVEWSSDFDVNGDSAQIVEEVSNDVLRPCLEKLEIILGERD